MTEQDHIMGIKRMPVRPERDPVVEEALRLMWEATQEAKTAERPTPPPVEEAPVASDINVNITQAAAPEPSWLVAYRNARSISWGVILIVIVAWFGSKVF